MKRTIPLLAFLAMGATLPAEAGDPNLGRLYTLEKTSDFQEGCFYLCECPIVMRNDLQGRFNLIPTGTENGYQIFSVVDLEWTVGADLVGPPIDIHGSGSFRISPSDQSQQLSLDLVVGNLKVEHYDSGLVPVTQPLPAIDIVVLTYPYGCYDTVLHVDALPATQSVRPPKLRFEQQDPALGAATTWGRLKKLWAN